MCIPFDGRESEYQAEAKEVWEQVKRKALFPWHWISTTCGKLCLQVNHMEIHGPKKLDYSPYECVYCGEPAEDRDHLLPEPATGKALRALVLTVPACHECNAFISDLPTANITKRREKAHEQIARKYAKVLKSVDRTEEDMEDYGPGLRTFLEGQAIEKQRIRARLDWPTEVNYDLDALERSGIYDPYGQGML
jgi:hypothetical protein